MKFTLPADDRPALGVGLDPALRVALGELRQHKLLHRPCDLKLVALGLPDVVGRNDGRVLGIPLFEFLDAAFQLILLPLRQIEIAELCLEFLKLLCRLVVILLHLKEGLPGLRRHAVRAELDILGLLLLRLLLRPLLNRELEGVLGLFLLDLLFFALLLISRILDLFGLCRLLDLLLGLFDLLLFRSRTLVKKGFEVAGDALRTTKRGFARSRAWLSGGCSLLRRGDGFSAHDFFFLGFSCSSLSFAAISRSTCENGAPSFLMASNRSLERFGIARSFEIAS